MDTRKLHNQAEIINPVDISTDDLFDHYSQDQLINTSVYRNQCTAGPKFIDSMTSV